LDARLTTFVYEGVIVAKSKKVKNGSNLAEFYQEGYGSRSAVLPM
jgi:hypothetical protein